MSNQIIARIPSNQKTLVIGNVEIYQDEHGRYNLNALHHASECSDDESKSPGHWLKRKSAKQLISELQSQVSFLPLEVVHGGDRRGTYAHELLAVSYAGWISPRFQLIVNQAFIDSKTKKDTIPSVVNPALQAIIDLVIRQDAVEQELISLKERERQRDQTLIAQQAEIIKSLQQSRMADEKATLALNDTYRMTIREFVMIGNLSHQFPESSWRSASTFLGDYCAERNLECPPKPLSGYKWPDEKSYPMSALLAWQRHETNKWKQISLDGIQEDGVWYTDK